MIVSAEDCHGVITAEIIALYQAWKKATNETSSKKPGRIEGRIFFSKAIVLLAECKHSRDQDELILLVSNRMPDDVFEAAMNAVEEVFEVNEADFDIPDYVHDVHTAQGRRRGATLEHFIQDEHEALSNKAPSVFGNFDEMVETWGYVEPKLTFEEGEQSGEG
jgi:hypothetical protein